MSVKCPLESLSAIWPEEDWGEGNLVEIDERIWCWSCTWKGEGKLWQEVADFSHHLRGNVFRERREGVVVFSFTIPPTPKNIWQSLETFWGLSQLVAKCYWHLGGRGQRCC